MYPVFPALPGSSREGKERTQFVKLKDSASFVSLPVADDTQGRLINKPQSLINENTIIDQLNDHYRSLRPPSVEAVKEEAGEINARCFSSNGVT